MHPELEILKGSYQKQISEINSPANRLFWLADSLIDPIIFDPFLKLAQELTVQAGLNLLDQKVLIFNGVSYPSATIKQAFTERRLAIKSATTDAHDQIATALKDNKRLALNSGLNSVPKILEAFANFTDASNSRSRRDTHRAMQRVENLAKHSRLTLHPSNPHTFNPYLINSSEETLTEVIVGYVSESNLQLAGYLSPTKELIRQTAKQIPNTNGRVSETIFQTLLVAAGFGIISPAQGIADRLSYINVNQTLKRFHEQVLPFVKLLPNHEQLNPKLLELAYLTLMAIHEPSHNLYEAGQIRSDKIRGISGHMGSEMKEKFEAAEESLQETSADTIAMWVGYQLFRQLGITAPENYIVTAKLLEAFKNIAFEPAKPGTYEGVYFTTDTWLLQKLEELNLIKTSHTGLKSYCPEKIISFAKNIAISNAEKYFCKTDTPEILSGKIRIHMDNLEKTLQHAGDKFLLIAKGLNISPEIISVPQSL